MPVIGFLNPTSPDAYADRLRAFRQGLKDTGYVEGENVAIEYRWAENQIDRLPALAAELVRRQVAVIAATGGHRSGVRGQGGNHDDPHRLHRRRRPGQAWSCRQPRPAGRQPDRDQFFHRLSWRQSGWNSCVSWCPQPARVAVLVNPANAATTETTLRDVEAAARAMGLQIQVLNASTSREINAAFATFVRERPDALFVGSDPFFTSRRVQLAHLAARHAIPATYSGREYAEAGGLMSYGANLADAYRQVGVYTGRILKGAKPADLPVVQSTKFELVINAETARMLGLTVPPTLLARADEVIE